MTDSHLVGEVKVERPSTPDSPSLLETVVALPLDYDIDVKYEEIEEQCLGSVVSSQLFL